MITAAQLRAARGLLDWTRSDLAKAASVSPETIKNIEHGTFRPQESTADAIVRAFAAHDVKFVENEGVQKKKDFLKTYTGDDEFKVFFDDMYEAARIGEAEICTLGVQDSLFIKHLGNYAQVHINRMSELKTKVRCIIKEGDQDIHCDAYNDYRTLPADKFSSIPFYIYNDRFSVVMFDKNTVTVVSIISRPVADAYRKQFDILWNEAQVISSSTKKDNK